jgi:lipoprotein-releasing system ATP-binding protein
VILQTQNLFKKYGNLEVLKGITLQVAASEIVSLVGASGAGKSSLLQILGTLDQPDSGTLLINSINPFELKAKDLAQFRNQQVGFVFQFHNLLAEFTALENILMPAMIAGQAEAKIDYAVELMAVLGISNKAQNLPSQMSGGEQQRIAIARAMINKPAIIFADEPSGNLDSNNAKEINKLFLKLRDTLGQTFVIVTHNQELAQLADRQLTILDGVIC